MIEVENLSKKYSEFLAVDNISMDVAGGEVFGFLGPNGAGKTTTIKMMAGVLKPTSGTVRIGGYDIQKEPINAKQIFGYIPDRPYIYEKLTGDEFLTFAGRLYGMNSRNAVMRRGKLLELFELHEWKNEPIESYSHGMKQRLVMASALLHEPSVVIIDEPMVGLDPKAAKMVKRIFREIANDGVCVFISTHTLDLAQETCDRIAIILQGQIIAMGSIQELKAAADSDDGKLESIFLKLTGGVVTEVGDFLRELNAINSKDSVSGSK